MTSLLILSVFFPFCTFIPTFGLIFVTYHLKPCNYTRAIFYSFLSGELILTGHETPVYIGISRITRCTWNGGPETIKKLDWYLFDLEGLGLGFELDKHTTLLNYGRVTNVGWNGKTFVCIGTTTNNRTLRITFALWVKGHYTKIMEIYFR